MRTLFSSGAIQTSIIRSLILRGRKDNKSIFPAVAPTERLAGPLYHIPFNWALVDENLCSVVGQLTEPTRPDLLHNQPLAHQIET
jgi:hypothetical protein